MNGDTPRTMTDAEIVANFMEPKPTEKRAPEGCVSGSDSWWTFGRRQDGDGWCDDWLPRRNRYPFTLNECHEVEAKLTEMQPFEYLDRFADDRWALVHATAEEKLAALAAVLRGAK